MVKVGLNYVGVSLQSSSEGKGRNSGFWHFFKRSQYMALLIKKKDFLKRKKEGGKLRVVVVKISGRSEE